VKITSKEQAVEEFVRVDPSDPQMVESLARRLWFEGKVDKFHWRGVDFEFIRTPKPVVMYTGHQLAGIVEPDSHGSVMQVTVKELEHLRDLILTRRAEMLRAVGDDRLLGELERAYEEFYPGPANGDGILAVYALVTEHIEANRPELTDEVIDGWLKEFKGHGPDAALSSLGSFIAHRTAEYKSNTDALRIKHGTELGALDAEYKKRVAEFNSVTNTCDAEVKELRAENERLKSELATARETHGVAYALLRGNRDELGEECDRLKNTIGSMTIEQEEREKAGREAGITARWLRGQLRELIYGNLSESMFLEGIREKCLSPQPVDDSDYWGIAVHVGSVSLVHRNHNGWELKQCVQGSWLVEKKPITLDPSRIFKVTSQPRGPLKVPSEETAGDLVAEWHADFKKVETTANQQAFARYCVQRAIDWIKKANERRDEFERMWV